MRGGKDYDPTFGKRMTGDGVFADLIATRFRKACARLGYGEREYTLRTDLFRAPRDDASARQFDLFDM